MFDSPALEVPIDSAASPSVSSLVRGIVADLKELLEQRVALARHEFQQSLQTVSRATLLIGIGSGCGLLAGIGLLFAAVECVSWAFPAIPLGGSLAGLGLLLAMLAWGMIGRGLREFDSLNFRREESSAMKETHDGRSAV